MVEKGFHKSANIGNGLVIVSPLSVFENNSSLRVVHRAKDIPNRATRRFLRDVLTVSVSYLHRPPLSLFDSDRDGIAMMQTYCQRSIALAHESSLIVPELKWVGFRLDDIMAGTMTDETVMPQRIWKELGFAVR